MTHPTNHSEDTLRDRSLVAILLFALVLRLAWGLISFDELAADPDGYRAIASCVRQHGIFGQTGINPTGQTVVNPTAFRPPLYPLILSAVAWDGTPSSTSVLVLHTILGLLIVAGTWKLTIAWGASWRIAGCAAFLVAIDPLLLHQSTLVMTETLATALTIASLLVLSWAEDRPTASRYTVAGVVVGITALCRPTALPFAGLVIVCLVVRPFWHRGRVGLPRMAEVDGETIVGLPFLERVVHAVAFGMGVTLALLPWGVRNSHQFQAPIVTTTHGGYTLLLANNPYFYGYLQQRVWGEPWDPTPFHRAWDQRRQLAITGADYWGEAERLAETGSTTGKSFHRTEVEEDRFANQLAKEVIRAAPARFVKACVVRVGWLWRMAPQRLAVEESWRQRLQRWLVGAWYSGVYLLVACSGLLAVATARRTERASEDPLLGGALGHSPDRRSHRRGTRRAVWVGSVLVGDGIRGSGWGVVLCISLTAVHAVYWSNIRMRAPLMPVVAYFAAWGCTAAMDWWRNRHKA